jgi:DeoR/GlpR family transcriptional regulator of sugar metabolism
MSDKFFIGTDGFSQKYGFTGRDHSRTQTVRDMAQQAGEVIVLTDSDKFSRRGVEGVVRTEQVSAVFTDELIPEEMESFLREKQVGVHKVPRTANVRPPEEQEIVLYDDVV